MKKAINLLELVIAIILLALIILGTTAFDIGNRGLLNYSEDRAALVNEANLVMDRIARDGVYAIGDLLNPALTSADTKTLTIRQDTSPAPAACPVPPAPLVQGNGRLDAADTTVVYAWNNNTHEITRTSGALCDTPVQVITSRATNFVVTPIGGNPASSYIVSVTICHDPANHTRDVTNPEVTVQTRIVSSAYSIH